MANQQARNLRAMHSTTLFNCFESVVQPYQMKIHVCPEFFKCYFNKLKKHPYAWLIDQHDRSVRVRFGQSIEHNFITSGKNVAAAFGWNRPTRVRFEFTGKFNRFKIAVVNNNNGPYQDMPIKEEVIEICSDSEDDEDYDDPDLYHFAKKITKSWENKRNSPIMHFPNIISINVLLDTQHTIALINWDTQKEYDCKLITSNRAPNEKYLGKNWNKFLKDNRLCEGDKLFFDLETPPNSLFVQIVRKDETN